MAALYTRLLRRDRALLLGLILLVLLLVLPTLTYPLGRDQGEFATIGRGILNGRIPYTELWNPKPPAVFYVYALTMLTLGRTTAALRALDLVIVPVIMVALYWLGRRIANRRVGLWAALIFPTFYFTESFWTLTQNDGIAALPMTLAVVAAFKARDALTGRRAFAWALVAGLLSGYAVWFKYPFALFGVGLAVAYLLITPQTGEQALAPQSVSRQMADRWRRSRAPVAGFVIGGLLVIVGGAALLAAQGAFDALLESARVTSQYTALTFNADDFRELLATAIGFRWQQWGLLWVLVALWVFIKRRDSEPTDTGWQLVLIWLLAGLLIMLVQAKGYDYHWLPMLPPLVLLAADTVDKLLGRLKTAARLVTVGVVAGFLVILAAGIWPLAWPYLSGQETQLEYYHHFQGGEFIADESLAVSNLLRERVVPGDSLFIWGFRPEVYYMSQLNPATRFIFQFPLVAEWYPPEWKEEAVDTLWAALPPYVLILQVDYMPWVTGSLEDSNTLLQAYTELNNWLIYNYEFDTQIGNFFVWRRKPAPR
ncbi:MAG: glycosyltransferase family 39 protein [Anaerolineaceae bacterium]|nr:glycosyltransferase family 39 protein [Anaerolineaceae bacterium]